ncbi:SAM-dependent methyltransferase [Candidatus Magnetomorum sp. HK-1]|nr:SAM-dependent methyltransferase [Candidatus Magnetomorum sp. HK-1]
MFEEAVSALEEEMKLFPNNNEAKKNYINLLSMKNKSFKKDGKHQIQSLDLNDLNKSLELANKFFMDGNFNKGVDLYEKLINTYNNYSIDLLAMLYDKYQILEKNNADRYTLYQSHFYDFCINPNSKVLDIGSGNIPFRYATFLADISVDEDDYGRAGKPFVKLKEKPAIQCDIEKLPFKDKEIDFVYCSHVLEHSKNPDKACKEIIRIAKRGFIEVPTRAKDMLLNTAKQSNHKWAIDLVNNTLVFTKYSEKDIKGIKTNLLMSMHVNPQTKREKAFSALLYLRADFFNVMLLWENSFKYKIYG